MLPPSAWDIAIRRAQGADGRIDVLAALDSARPLDGDILVAEVGDEPIAAIDLHNGRAVANPMRPTAEAISSRPTLTRAVVSAVAWRSATSLPTAWLTTGSRRPRRKHSRCSQSQSHRVYARTTSSRPRASISRAAPKNASGSGRG